MLLATRCLLQRNELLSTNTGTAVATGLVSHGELSEVVADHFSLKMRLRKQKKRHLNMNRSKRRRKVGSGQVREGHLDSDVGAYLDLHVDEELAVVDTHDGADHLGDDGHVSQVSLDGGGLVEGSGGLLSLAQLLEQCVVSTGDTACKTTTNAASQKLQKLLLALVKQCLELNATEAGGGVRKARKGTEQQYVE